MIQKVNNGLESTTKRSYKMDNVIKSSFVQYTTKKYNWINVQKLLRKSIDFRLVYHILRGGVSFKSRE